MLSQNSSAMHLLEKNQNKINWSALSANPSAMHLLEKIQIKFIGCVWLKIRQIYGC